MNLLFACPRCEQTIRSRDVQTSRSVRCRHCDWSRDFPDQAVENNRPRECLVCGCGDLWRQKDFPARIGLLMVALGALLSTIAWTLYEPMWAIGILMAFALIDLVLFLFMPDVLVCYRCAARHRDIDPNDSTPHFDHETAERYRQEEKRLRKAGSAPG